MPFHIAVRESITRTGYAFNLSEDEVRQRFVHPWEAGTQIVAQGFSFEPSNVQVQVYEGPPITTSNSVVGWLHVQESGEEVTDRFIVTPPGAQGGSDLESPADEVDPRNVVLMHGRDSTARRAIADFIRSLDLNPLDWESIVQATGSAAPFTGEVVQQAFRMAKAVVVLLTPDDEARLHPDLHGADEPEYETRFTGQARPNVLFELGMAFGVHPERTIIVEIGRLRPISDLAGRNTIRVGTTPDALVAIANRLESAGCPIRRTSSDYLDSSRFAGLAARTRQPTPGLGNGSQAGVLGFTVSEGHTAANSIHRTGDGPVVADDGASAVAFPVSDQEDEADEGPGFLELLAEMEEALPDFNVTMMEISRVTVELGNLARDYGERLHRVDEQGTGARGRLAVILSYTNSMEPLTVTMAELTDSLVRRADSIEPGVFYMLGAVREDPSQLQEAPGFLPSLIELGASSQDAITGVRGFHDSLEGIQNAARPLRQKIRVLRGAIRQIIVTMERVQSWGERARSVADAIGE